MIEIFKESKRCLTSIHEINNLGVFLIWSTGFENKNPKINKHPPYCIKHPRVERFKIFERSLVNKYSVSF